MNFRQRIVSVLFQILIIIFIGIHDINKFSQIKSHLIQRFLPVIFLKCQYFSHDPSKTSRDQIQLCAPFLFTAPDLIQLTLNRLALSRIFPDHLFHLTLQGDHPQFPGKFFLVLPVILLMIISQDQIHVCRIIRHFPGKQHLFLKGMDLAAPV